MIKSLNTRQFNLTSEIWILSLYPGSRCKLEADFRTGASLDQGRKARLPPAGTQTQQSNYNQLSISSKHILILSETTLWSLHMDDLKPLELLLAWCWSRSRRGMRVTLTHGGACRLDHGAVMMSTSVHCRTVAVPMPSRALSQRHLNTVADNNKSLNMTIKTFQ